MTLGRVFAWSLAALFLFACVKAFSWWKNPWVPGSGAYAPAPSASAVYIPGCADKPDCK